MGSYINYVVVAEGVENTIQKDYLVAYGCDRAQGYYFSRPLVEEAAKAFIENSNQKNKS